MKNIKFRGRSITTNGWVYGYFMKSSEGKSLIREIDPGYESISDVEVIPETVGMFTDLTDKNGKEIYEGDIIERSGSMYEIVSELGNNCGECYWVWGWEVPDEKEIIEEHYTIAGNTYENPELLK